MNITFEINPEDVKAIFLEDIKNDVEYYFDKFNFWDDDEINKIITDTIKVELHRQLDDNKDSIESMVQEAIEQHTKDIALELLAKLKKD